MSCILIVDDHPINREFLATLLGYRGDRVLQAENGAEALELVRSERPDLVITDVLMPVMDGYEFVQLLRADPAITNTPVIFCTAFYQDTQARTLAASCGVTHVLGKPCEPELVLQAVEKALSTAGETPPAPTLHDFDREHLQVMTSKLVSMASDLGQVNERLAELIEINLQLASLRNPRQLLDSMCHSARRLIGAHHAVLAVTERGNEKKAIYLTTSGIDDALLGQFGAPVVNQGLLGEMLHKRRTQRGTAAAEVLGLPQPYPPIHAFVAAPIVSIGQVYGWICLTEPLGNGQFSEEDERLLGILAAQVGRIYENGSIYAQLQEKEERFRQMADHISEVFFLISPDGQQMLYVNCGYETLWGRSRDSLYQNPQSWLESVHPQDIETANAGFGKMDTTGSFDTTFRIVRPDGSLRWIRARGFPIRDATGQLYRVAGLAEDVTASRESDTRIRRLNRVYAVLSGINTTIVRIRDRKQLFDEACRIAVQEGNFRMSWIGTREASGRIVPRAWAGYEDGYLRFLDGQQGSAGLDSSLLPAVQAVRQQRAVIHNRIDTADNVSWHKEALARGYSAEAAFPLVLAGKAIGVICLYAAEANFFDTDEIKLLNELASDISFAMEFIENENRLKHAAYFDELTGLVNRNSLYQSLGELLAGSAAPKHVALILLNMNGFRDINNTLGHHNGDELIRQVARRLQTAIYGSDIVAALGGDTFAVLLPRIAEPDHVSIALDKILLALQRSFSIADIPISVEVTMGVALFPDHGNSAELLWQRADIALRSARESHKTHQFYDRSIDRFDPRQLALMGELRNAITNDELVLYYQPKIDLATGRPAGVEALVRWQNPRRGLIFPDEFIPSAERTDLINSLTSWVLAEALRQISALRKLGFPLDISVNISVRNLQSPEMCSNIIALVHAARLPFLFLTLEITESAIMDDPEHAKRVLNEFSAAGIGLAVDDFGMGHSSLHYIKELPISKIKIDKSFVMEFQNPRNAAIVRSTIELGHNLGLTVVAEGVENEHTRKALRDLGCDRAQGYFFSKPLPAAELVVWLENYIPWDS